MRVFLAGATGATGQVFIPAAEAAGVDLVLHVRPRSADKLRDPRARVFELDDAPALAEALRGCDAVVSLVGTMRKRFEQGDTYASADVGSTRALVAGATAAGVPRFLLLSSYGAGGAGAYLKMKGECEALVRESGLGWDIFRPSALVSPADGPKSHHGRREVPPGAMALGGLLRQLPGLRGVVDDVRPIPLTVLCRAMLVSLGGPAGNRVWEGRDLWEVA